jgi:hypothetical protein
MLKEPPLVTKGMREEVESYVTDNFKKYEVPLTIDAELCVLLNYTEKKERILARENPLRYTWCKESGKERFGIWHMLVGSLAPSGLGVSSDDESPADPFTAAYGRIGVCPVRKFYSH